MNTSCVRFVASQMNKIIFYIRFFLFPKSIPYEIQIETTSICNAKCNFCPNSYLKREKMVMTDEVFDMVMRRLREEGLQISRFLLLLCGEPLIDKQIFQRINRIKKQYPNAQIEFTTNFSLANESIIEEMLNSGLDTVTISLNACNKEEYEKVMHLKYDKTIENLNLLERMIKQYNSKLNVKLSIVVSDDNRDSIQLFHDMWDELFDIREICLGNWVGEKQNVIDKRDRRGTCPILFKTINILSNGDYALCCFDAEGCVGKNVMTDRVLKAYRSPKFMRIRLHHLLRGRTNEECQECSF